MRVQNLSNNRSTSLQNRTGRYRTGPSLQQAAQGRNSLKKGHKGPGVQALQQKLQQAGFQIAADGKFGPKTDAALRMYQAQKGLKQDGLAGPNTIGSMLGASGTTPVSNTFQNGQAPNKFGQSDTNTAPTRAQTQARPDGTVRPSDISVPPPNRRGKAAAGKNLTASFDRVSKAGRRNQMVSGQITVNGNTYNFNSGGGGKGNLPAGTYKVTRHLDRRSDKNSMMRDGVGYSFAMSDKYDSRVNATRKLLRIHPDGGGKGTIGCIGIVGNGDVQRRFRADMLAEIKRNGGSVNLQVG